MNQLGVLGSIGSLGGGGGLGLKNPNDLQVAMLQSRTVQDALIDRFHLMERYHCKLKTDARSRLEKVVDINNGAKDGLIRVEVTDRDPRFAADLANGYIDEFKRFSANLAITEASRRRLFFEQQLSEAKDNLANAEEELKKTQQRTGLIQLDSQARATIELVANLRAQIAAKEAQVSAMRSFATGENPELQIAEQQLDGLRTEAAKIGATSEGTTNALIPKGNMQEAGLEYVRKLRDVKYYETIFDLIARQYEAAKVDEARQGALVQVVDRAIVPERHSSPKRALIILGSAVLGCILGIFIAFSSAGLQRLERNPSERDRLNELKTLISPKKQETHQRQTKM
jgi:tyrosine-protein kinase Etk/Wzc